METDVLIRERMRREMALKILGDLALMAQWSQYGKPYLVGAVYYGLVVSPDIDMEVYCPEQPRVEDGFKIMSACAGNPNVISIRFENHINGPDQGYYWQIHYVSDDGMDWKIDLWSVHEDHPGPTARDMREPMLAALTENSRRAILEIKEKMLIHKYLVPSIYLYQAVLQDEISTFSDFKEWVLHNRTEGLVDWQPTIE